MKRIATVAAMLAAAATIPPVPVRAETGKSFQVGATIAAGCLIEGPGAASSSFGHLDFGEAPALSAGTHSASLSANQTITLRCTPQTSLSMSIDAGAHGAGGIRHLQRGADVANRITYALCSDAACTQPIAAASPVGIAVTAINANDVRLPVYGRLTLSGARPAGTYGDTLTVTLSW